MSEPTYPTSSNGYYAVTLNAGFTHTSFFYSPDSLNIVVDETVLAAMIEAGVVETIRPNE